MVRPELPERGLLLLSIQALRLQLSSAHQGLQVAQRSSGDGIRDVARKKLIDIAQDAPDTVILAEDEAKVYLQASTMATWAPRGQAFTVRCDPGRAHASFYGTLNLKTGQEIVTRAETMNAEASALHLQALLDAHIDVNILLLWDRAPYHRGEAIRTLREANPRLEILEFPTAAPDLNPQEHVWRATRRKVCHNHSERRLPGLAARFEEHLTGNTFHSSFLDRYGWYLVCPGFT